MAIKIVSIEENNMHKQRVFNELSKYYTTLNHIHYVVKVLLCDIIFRKINTEEYVCSTYVHLTWEEQTSSVVLTCL